MIRRYAAAISSVSEKPVDRDDRGRQDERQRPCCSPARRARAAGNTPSQPPTCSSQNARSLLAKKPSRPSRAGSRVCARHPVRVIAHVSRRARPVQAQSSGAIVTASPSSAAVNGIWHDSRDVVLAVVRTVEQVVLVEPGLARPTAHAVIDIHVARRAAAAAAAQRQQLVDARVADILHDRKARRSRRARATGRRGW